MTYNLNTLQRAVALGAAGVVLAATPALARPDYPLKHVTQYQAGTARSALDLRSPDATDAAVTPPTDLRSPDAADASATRAPVTSSLAGTISPTPHAPVSVVSSKADDGLEWGSIGIGAGAVVALSLIGLGGAALTHRQRIHAAR
jgi:hypothetical protein